MASPAANNNTSGFDAFLPRINPREEDAGEIEEAAERAWLAHVRRGHEFRIDRPASYPPIKPHPTDTGKPLRSTALWPGRPDKRRRGS